MEIGIIANPASGKDIRRLSGGASVFNNQEKQQIVKRCLRGIFGICKPTIRYFPDSHQITSSALHELKLDGTPVELTLEGTAQDSTNAACELRSTKLLISLGGDGTNRAIAKGWLDVPLIAISTGTNNAFPAYVEATTAGFAAGLIARRLVGLEEVSSPSKVIHVSLDSGSSMHDLALIDVVATNDRFVGSKAILDTSKYRCALVTEANPSKPGTAGIGGCIERVTGEQDAGLFIQFEGPPRYEVTAPVSPGIIGPITFSHHAKIGLNQTIEIRGPCTLAFDGEREHVALQDQIVRLEIKRNGPRLVDIPKVLDLATERGVFLELEGNTESDYAN